jgi:hypothetical protein
MLTPRTTLVLAAVGLVSWVGSPFRSVAQDLEPRAYAAAPIGTNFFGVAAGRSSGDVLVDPSIPLTDVHATVNSTVVGGGRTFSFFGRTALLSAAFPYAWPTVSGETGETRRSVSLSGLTDPRIRLSVNFVGGKALKPDEFTRARRPTIVGASLTVAPPLGQYDRTRLVNLGSNRWSMKPEAGISHRMNNWIFDGYAGIWFFAANNFYYTGSSIRTQQPIVTIQGHTSYTFKPRLWLAFDATWYSGGTTSIDGVKRGSPQRNVRIGSTFSLPLTRQQSLKIAYGKGAMTRAGSNFTTVSAAWQLTWFD